MSNVNLFLGVIFETLKAYPDQRGFSNNWLICKVILLYTNGQNPIGIKDARRTEKQTLTIEQKALKWDTFKCCLVLFQDFCKNIWFLLAIQLFIFLDVFEYSYFQDYVNYHADIYIGKYLIFSYYPVIRISRISWGLRILWTG